jgi:hypothetical protein
LAEHAVQVFDLSHQLGEPGEQLAEWLGRWQWAIVGEPLQVSKSSQIFFVARMTRAFMPSSFPTARECVAFMSSSCPTARESLSLAASRMTSLRRIYRTISPPLRRI